MPDRKPLPGKFVWFEHVSREAKKAQAFYREVLGWTLRPFPMGDFTYDMIYTGETMIGGFAAPQHKAHWDRGKAGDGPKSHWICYVSVEDVDASAQAAAANGGKVVEPPYDAPGVGRMARIADPNGAELSLIKNANGDAPDGQLPPGALIWNELHTPDPKRALAFYEKVVGFSHHDMDMGPAGTYHIIAKGGIDRGGVTSHLQPGTPAHWLPYVMVEDVDGTMARVRDFGGKIQMKPEEIPGVGRVAGFEDPTGAILAVIKPQPMQR